MHAPHPVVVFSGVVCVVRLKESHDPSEVLAADVSFLSFPVLDDLSYPGRCVDERSVQLVDSIDDHPPCTQVEELVFLPVFLLGRRQEFSQDVEIFGVVHAHGPHFQWVCAVRDDLCTELLRPDLPGRFDVVAVCPVPAATVVGCRRFPASVDERQQEGIISDHLGDGQVFFRFPFRPVHQESADSPVPLDHLNLFWLLEAAKRQFVFVQPPSGQPDDLQSVGGVSYHYSDIQQGGGAFPLSPFLIFRRDPHQRFRRQAGSHTDRSERHVCCGADRPCRCFALDCRHHLACVPTNHQLDARLAFPERVLRVHVLGGDLSCAIDDGATGQASLAWLAPKRSFHLCLPSLLMVPCKRPRRRPCVHGRVLARRDGARVRDTPWGQMRFRILVQRLVEAKIVKLASQLLSPQDRVFQGCWSMSERGNIVNHGYLIVV